MPGHDLIDAYRAALARRLPASIVDELTDGLIETYQQRLNEVGDPDQAARQALRNFGGIDEITRTFTIAAPARATARLLLATGPLVGVAWASVLITQQAWQWPVPLAARLTAGLIMLAAVALLAVTAVDTSHFTRNRATALTVCAVILILDTGAIGTSAILVPLTTWPLACAVIASLSRIALTAHELPRLWTS